MWNPPPPNWLIYCGGLGSIRGQFIWPWCGLSGTEAVFLRVLQISPVGIIRPVIHILISFFYVQFILTFSLNKTPLWLYIICLLIIFADPPQIIDVGPDRVMTAPLYSQATFSCNAEGNPSPTYQWLQKLPTAEGTVLIRGSDSRLHISNVTYDYKGEYVCKATNVIAGVERLVQSDAISVQVVGKSLQNNECLTTTDLNCTSISALRLFWIHDSR